jgi:hypothetical protein
MGCPNQELHAAAGAAITGNESCPHAAAKATEAAAPEAAEASTTAARRIADTPTHGYTPPPSWAALTRFPHRWALTCRRVPEA